MTATPEPPRRAGRVQLLATCLVDALRPATRVGDGRILAAAAAPQGVGRIGR